VEHAVPPDELMLQRQVLMTDFTEDLEKFDVPTLIVQGGRSDRAGT
jgi:hypothetical protein